MCAPPQLQSRAGLGPAGNAHIRAPGYDSIDGDVRRQRDGSFVLLHDKIR